MVLSKGPELALARMVNKRNEGVGIDRFDQVMVEASCPGSTSVLFLAVSGNCDQKSVLTTFILAQLLSEFVAIHRTETKPTCAEEGKRRLNGLMPTV